MAALASMASSATADVCADAELAEAVVANIDRHVVITAPLEQL